MGVQEGMPERLGQHEYWSIQTAAAPQAALLRRRVAATDTTADTAAGTAAGAGFAAARWSPGLNPSPAEVLLDCNDPQHVPTGCQLAQVRLLPKSRNLNRKRKSQAVSRSNAEAMRWGVGVVTDTRPSWSQMLSR